MPEEKVKTMIINIITTAVIVIACKAFLMLMFFVASRTIDRICIKLWGEENDKYDNICGNS